MRRAQIAKMRSGYGIYLRFDAFVHMRADRAALSNWATASA